MEYNYDGGTSYSDPTPVMDAPLSRGKQLGFSIGGMACGIWAAYFGVLFGWCYGMGLWLGLPFGIAGLILSSKVLKCNPEKHAMASAGKVTSIIGIIGSVVGAIIDLCIVLFYIIVYGGVAAYSIFDNFNFISMLF